MRKINWPLATVLVLALVVLVGGGVWLSLRGAERLKAGTLLSETASEALVGRTAEVRVPWGRLQVTLSEPLTETEDGKMASQGMSLVGVQVTLTGQEGLLVADRLPDAALADPVFTLVADKEEYVLKGLTGWVEEGEVAALARRQYVAVEGQPSNYSLRVAYDGVDQVVDGPTGKLEIGAAAPLYQLGLASGPQPCGDPLWSPGASAVDKSINWCLVRSSAQRPHVAGLGWAPEGRTWLVLTVLTGAPPEFEGPAGTYDVKDSTSTYLLDVQAPVESFALNDAMPEGFEKDVSDPQVVIFDVDPNRPTGQFEVRTRMTGEAEKVTGKGDRTKTTTFEAMVAQGAFV